ncbi:MAG: colanic acid biosynthesis glycosyltransferase WcaL [Candidatus Binatia bacterium]|nr:MAG: colanic acid biosynthesis glycosyltransferase WcaL [Candidatus Binatia bacterium]
MTAGTEPLAFLYPAFPVLHQTFVMWEAVALRRLGLGLRLYSLEKPPPGKQQPEAEVLRQEVTYLPAAWSFAVLRANARSAWQRPGKYVEALARLMREWWRDRKWFLARKRGAAKTDAPMSWKMRAEAWWNTSPTVYLLKTLWLFPKAVYLGERLQREGISRIHAHWATYATSAALLLRWLYGFRFSFTAHAYDIYLMPVLLRAKLREADFVVTCARVNAEHLRALASENDARVVVNYHGVDLARFAPRPRCARESLARIVTCGSLRLYKGHHVLIEACARVHRPVHCVIIGEGPYRSILEAQVRRLGLVSRVQFTGALVQEKVAEEYAKADLFVLASVVLEDSGRQDVIPNVLVEAMAMGLPVIASDLPGIRELITNGVEGRLVPPNDPQALAQAIEELLDNPSLCAKLARGGRERVVKHFDRERNVRDLAALFCATL